MENEAAVQRVEVNMPMLTLETSLRSKRQLGLLLGVQRTNTPRGKQLADGFVRLVEKTILEYQASRERLIAFLKDGFPDDCFRAQDHFESSIQSLHRAIRYLEGLRRKGFQQADGTAFVPRPRELEVLRDSIKAKVRALRDFIEHLDEDILDERTPPDAKIGVQLSWEKASLNGAEITYSDFVRWGGQLHRFAVLLSQVHITVGPVPS
jgi:hypothetical protein